MRIAAVLVLMASILAASFTAAAQEETYPFATDEFSEVWARTDAPVAEHGEPRTWIWGPGPRSEPMIEEYAETGDEGRVVQYFDKSRLEMPWSGDADPGSAWFITQGLLATELMTGNLQLGDNAFEQHFPSDTPVAGDPGDTGGPTYAVMGEVMDRDPRPAGSVISEQIDNQGSISEDPAFAAYDVTDDHVDAITGHAVASVFWDFMNSTSTISVDGETQQGPLFENPLYAVGRPLTDAFWTAVPVDGEQQDVLLQCFERRCLTYAPENPDGWQVESGNTGMHYRDWRYEQIDRDNPITMDPVVEPVLENVPMPTELSFTDDGRLFFNEVFEGNIRVIENGQLLDQPFAQLDIGIPDGHTEHGLLGLAFHPDYEENRYVYAFYTYADGEGMPGGQRIVRFTDQDNVGVNMEIIVDHLPYGPNCCHNSGRIAFGPDGMLYVTIGDTEQPETSQNLNTLAGSVLRYTPDGAIPEDNPFGNDNPIYAYGLRNPFGIAFDPVTDDMFLTENGPDGYDEVNRIVPGGNYGWPEVEGIAGHEDYIDPIWATMTERVAPTGITIPTGDVAIPDIAGDVLFCQFNTNHLVSLQLAGGDFDTVTCEAVLPVDCNLDVTQGPDCAIYTSTTSAILRYGPPMQ